MMRKCFSLKPMAVAVLLSALFVSCTKSGALTGNTSTSSFSGNVTGSANGGLSPISGATVNLRQAGSSISLASTTTNTDGSFSIVYSNVSGSNLLYLSIAGGNSAGTGNPNNQLLSIVGTSAAALSSLRVNEVTTAATELLAINFGLLQDVNGSISLKATNNATTANNMVKRFMEMIAGGNLNTADANLSASAQTGLNAMANDFASCIETPSKCATLFSTATTSSGVSAVSLLESGFNALSNSTNTASGLYTIAFPLNSTTGFTLTSATMPGGFSFNNGLPTTTNTFSVGNTPQWPAIDASGNLWVPNNGGANVTELSSSGALLGSFSVGATPRFAVIDASGNVWVSNGGSNTVTELSSLGATLGTFSAGSAPFGLAFDANGNLWVSDFSSTTVTELSSSGTLIGTFSSGSSPTGIAIDGSGNVWVSNNSSNSVTELSSSGSSLGTFSVPNASAGIAVDVSGNIWVTQNASNSVTEISSSRTIIGTFSGISGPAGLAIDASGDVWAGNTSGVKELSSSGTTLGSFSGGNTTRGVAIDATGNVWVVNQGNNTVIQVQGIAPGPFFPYSGPIFP